MSNRAIASKDVQLEITGHNKHGKHGADDIARMLSLLGELLRTIGCFGTFKVKATSTGLKGTPRLQGLSVVGFTGPNTIGLGYQLRSNDSRCKYNLFAPAEQAASIWERLKNAAGTAYLGLGKDSEKPVTAAKQLAKPLTLVPPSRVTNMAPTQPAPNVAALAPVTESAVVTKTAVRAPTSNPVWVAEYVKRATALAESNEYKWLTKPQVLALITELANLPSNWQAGPVFMALLSKGWLAIMPNGMYKPVIENPVPTKQNQKKSVPVTPVVAKVKAAPVAPVATKERVVPMRTKNRFATSFFSNSALQTTFFAHIGTKTVQGTELTRLILETFSHWKPQAAGHLFGYLVQEEYLVRINPKTYTCGPKGLEYLALSSPAEPVAAMQKEDVAIEALVLAASTAPTPPTVEKPTVTESSLTDLQNLATVVAKATKYKAQAAAETLRADTAEAALQAEELITTSLKAQIQNFDHQVEARARAMLDQMIKDL